MRVLFIHGTNPSDEKYATELARAIEKTNHQAEVKPALVRSSAPLSTAPYQLICVISSFKGWWKPQLPHEIQSVMKKCTRLEGKKGAAFVPAKLGSVKALKNLMSLMETQGILVEDFGAIRGMKEIGEIASRLAKLG